MFERFTEEARSTVVLAQEEARRLHHNYVGTEHVLLALLRSPSGAADVLNSFGIMPEPTRAAVIGIVGQGGESPSGHIPFTPRSKKVLELSLREAIKLGDNHIGSGHLLLGLLREGEGLGAQVLVQQGADLERLRAAVLAEMSRSPGGSTSASRSPSSGYGKGGRHTPAADTALAVARQLAAAGPVGSHHLLEALARSPESAAARVLAELGVDAEALAAKIDEVGLDGTTDLTSAEAAARRITVRLEGDSGGALTRHVVIELGDEQVVGLVTTITEATGGPLRGDDIAAGSLVGLWEAVSAELTKVAGHLTGTAATDQESEGDEGGVLGPVRAAIQGRLRRRRPPAVPA